MKKSLLPILIALAFSPLAQSQESSPAMSSLKSVTQQAVLNSPEVTSKWHALKAAEEEIGVGRGGYFPRVDVSTGAGREHLKTGVAGSTAQDYTRSGYQASLTQMLFDGFMTRNEVRRLDKARLVRYYELLEASENTALEAARAYLDVLRFRRLVELAQDNYVQHKAIRDQIEQRTRSGVGRRVDLEQASSRLTLAEINLLTETANLHDVSARYQRLVGKMPASDLTPPAQMAANIPGDARSALDVLHRKNPTLLASIENIEAANYEIANRRGSYSPRLDLRVRAEDTNHYLGETGRREYGVAEVVASWNLLNGGSDRAREKQSIEKKNLAIDLREKACRDTRQTLLIAYNDVQRLKEQVAYQQRQVALLEKTRDAYRDQFNVGQRTLLDLLDTENELLAARRAAANAENDLLLSQIRTYAGMGTLLEELGLQRLDAKTPGQDELADFDASQLCPTEPVMLTQADRAALDARAAALNNKPTPVLAPLAAPVQPEAQASSAETEIGKRLKSWAEAWSSRDYSAYAAFYAPNFKPDNNLTRAEWEQLRRSRVSGRNTINVDVQDLKVRTAGPDSAVAEFRQVYTSDGFSDTTGKILEMVRVDGKWMILGEHSAICAGNTVGGCKPAR